MDFQLDLDMTTIGLTKEYAWLLSLPAPTANQLERKELIHLFVASDSTLATLLSAARQLTPSSDAAASASL